MRHLDVISLVLRLLHREDVVVEMLLQLLVGIVDAELLKAVGLEDFEACGLRHHRKSS